MLALFCHTRLLLLIHFLFLFAATTSNFTSSFEMEMSQAGFSAHTSKVSRRGVIYPREIHKYQAEQRSVTNATIHSPPPSCTRRYRVIWKSSPGSLVL